MDASVTPLFDAYAWSNGLTRNVARQTARRFAALDRVATRGGVGSQWKEEGLTGRSPMPATTADASPPAEPAVVRIFGEILQRGTGWLDVLEQHTSSDDAVAAIGLLSMREPCHPAWRFNPRIEPDDRARKLLRDVQSGAVSVTEMMDVDLERARIRLLLRACHDARVDVQDAALSALAGGRYGYGLPDDRVNQPWRCFPDDVVDELAAIVEDNLRRSANGTLASADVAWRTKSINTLRVIIHRLRSHP